MMNFVALAMQESFYDYPISRLSPLLQMNMFNDKSSLSQIPSNDSEVCVESNDVNQTLSLSPIKFSFDFVRCMVHNASMISDDDKKFFGKNTD